MRPRLAGRAWAGALALLTLLAVAACGDSTDGDTTSKAPPAASPAAHTGSGALGGASAAISPAPSAAITRTESSEPVSAITIAATDNVFTPAEFHVRAGYPFTVTLENRGQAAHDWRVRGLADDTGRDVGTRLLTAGQSETVTLTIDRPGEYALYCEVHPIDMRGKLTVQE
jgi:plastocyanin